MKTIGERLETLRAGGAVRRFHTERTIDPETVGQHTFGVIGILFLLLDEPELRLIKAALHHDLSEQLTGDIPAPTKWQSPGLRRAEKEVQTDFDRDHGLEVALSMQEHLILKYADMLDLMASSSDMVRMGNTFALQIHHRISVRIHDTTRLDNHIIQGRIDDLWMYLHMMTKGDPT